MTEQIETLMIWPDDYEYTDENGDIKDMEGYEWYDFLENLESTFKEYNTKNDDEYYWKVIGHHMGWLKREGYKYVRAKGAAWLLSEILPKDDCRIQVVREDTGTICLSVGHHDGSDYYELIPLTYNEFMEEGG